MPEQTLVTTQNQPDAKIKTKVIPAKWILAHTFPLLCTFPSLSHRPDACRHGATSVGEFRDEGYLPDAMTNFLALLGWNEGDGSQREMYSLDELVQAFSLGRITKSGAVFDKTKLSWMNGASAIDMFIHASIAVIQASLHGLQHAKLYSFRHSTQLRAGRAFPTRCLWGNNQKQQLRNFYLCSRFTLQLPTDVQGSMFATG